jgi:hypothetical protein
VKAGVEARPARAERPRRPAPAGERPSAPRPAPPPRDRRERPRSERPAEARRPPDKPTADRRPEPRRQVFNNPFAVLASLKVPAKGDKS